MFDALVKLFHNFCASQQRLLRSQLLVDCMSKKDTMVSFLTRINELKDQLAVFGTKGKD